MTTVQVPDYPPISQKLSDNVTYLNQQLGVGTSWDILAKPFQYGELNIMSYAANGFFLTMNMVLMIENFQKSIVDFEDKRNGKPFTLDELVTDLTKTVAFVQVQKVPKMKDAIRFILSGALIIFFDGYDEALLIDTRIYPMRSIDEPDLERTIRGAKDGFTETMLMNTALIRRRIRDPRLRSELFQVGTVSQTDISFLYIEGVASEDMVNTMRDKITSVQVSELFMAEQSLVEHMGRVKWNPYPIVRYTQRPDVAAEALIEGQVVIVVDTSPEIIIAPVTYFHHLQHPQEYHSYPLVGTYMRWVILLAVLGSVVLPGLFLVFNGQPHWIPRWLTFFRADKGDPLPLWVELIVAEAGLDLLRLAVVNTPKALASSVGIVAALLFGQFASKIGLLQPEVMVYMGSVMLAQLATSSYELGSANQMARLWVIVWSGCLHILGFGIAIVSWVTLLATTRSFGIPYLWPLIPFQWKSGLQQVIMRGPMQEVNSRPFGPWKRSK